jgi:serralysin
MANLPGSPSAAPKPYSCKRLRFVDMAMGRRGRSDGTKDNPWPTIEAAAESGNLTPGDCVTIAPGDYRSGTIHLRKGGDPTGYVAFVSAVPHAARIVAARGAYSLIAIEAPYIVIDGLDVDGDHAAAEGPAIDDEGGAGHHVMVLNNLVHDAGGSGIQLNDTDYLTVAGNIVRRNASTNGYQMSGISIYQPRAVNDRDASGQDRSFHIVIENNVAFENAETFPCRQAPGCHTDGNGIIIDSTLNRDRADGTPYPFPILVRGNLVYRNGGKGIQVAFSAGVVVANNTAYGNNLDLDNSSTWRGELSNAQSHDVTWINNIGWAMPVGGNLSAKNTAVSQGATADWSGTNVTWIGNISFNGRAGDPSVNLPTGGAVADFRATNEAGIDPMLVDPRSADFHPRPGSPAVGGGVPLSAGVSRLSIGAY